MAQLNDLIVNGYTRFLNSAYGNLNGSATSALCAAYAAAAGSAPVASHSIISTAHSDTGTFFSGNSARSACSATSAKNAGTANYASKVAISEWTANTGYTVTLTHPSANYDDLGYDPLFLFDPTYNALYVGAQADITKGGVITNYITAFQQIHTNDIYCGGFVSGSYIVGNEGYFGNDVYVGGGWDGQSPLTGKYQPTLTLNFGSATVQDSTYSSDAPKIMFLGGNSTASYNCSAALAFSYYDTPMRFGSTANHTSLAGGWFDFTVSDVGSKNAGVLADCFSSKSGIYTKLSSTDAQITYITATSGNFSNITAPSILCNEIKSNTLFSFASASGAGMTIDGTLDSYDISANYFTTDVNYITCLTCDSNSRGWVKFAKIYCNQYYMNTPFVFTVMAREYGTYRLEVILTSLDNYKPPIENIRVTCDLEPFGKEQIGYTISTYKISNVEHYSYEFWLRKSENYGSVGATVQCKDTLYNCVLVNTNEYSDTEPTGITYLETYSMPSHTNAGGLSAVTINCQGVDCLSMSQYYSWAKFYNLSAYYISSFNYVVTPYVSGNLSGSATSALTSKSALSAGSSTSALNVRWTRGTDNTYRPICFADAGKSGSYTAGNDFYGCNLYDKDLKYNPTNHSFDTLNAYNIKWHRDSSNGDVDCFAHGMGEYYQADTTININGAITGGSTDIFLLKGAACTANLTLSSTLENLNYQTICIYALGGSYTKRINISGNTNSYTWVRPGGSASVPANTTISVALAGTEGGQSYSFSTTARELKIMYVKDGNSRYLCTYWNKE